VNSIAQASVIFDLITQLIVLLQRGVLFLIIRSTLKKGYAYGSSALGEVTPPTHICMHPAQLLLQWPWTTEVASRPALRHGDGCACACQGWRAPRATAMDHSSRAQDSGWPDGDLSGSCTTARLSPASGKLGQIHGGGHHWLTRPTAENEKRVGTGEWRRGSPFGLHCHVAPALLRLVHHQLCASHCVAAKIQSRGYETRFRTRP
jgi:hypothetical protein